MGRPSKPLISKKKTLEVALRIVDAEGLDALSIRRLGRELSIQGISLYHHFKDKEEILTGACALALTDVRTPTSSDMPWKEWLFRNAVLYHEALLRHPNLIPVLMRRHPLRIGLAEHNSTAGLLAVQGVPAGAVMPVMEALEELALGSASYQSAVANDQNSDLWKAKFPLLFHLSKQSALNRRQIFELVARSAIDAIVNAVADDQKQGESHPIRNPVVEDAEPPHAAAAGTLGKRRLRTKGEKRTGSRV